MGDNYKKRQEYADSISLLRTKGNLSDAIEKCIAATIEFPNNNFFYKILGDMYMQIGDFPRASSSYLEHLQRIADKPDQFKTFAKFYRVFSRNVQANILDEYKKEIFIAARDGKIAPSVIEMLRILIGDNFLNDNRVSHLIDLTKDNKQIHIFQEELNKLIQDRDETAINIILKHRIDYLDNINNNVSQFDYGFISTLEKGNQYEQAITLIEKLLSKSNHNPTLIRSLFRVCRLVGDYSSAQRLLEINEEFVAKSDFNIQYELVYYFEYIGDQVLLDKALSVMRNGARHSIPIARTLYNFYLRLNMFEEAQDFYEHINELELSQKKQSSEQRRQEQIESEKAIWQRLKDLVSEQEHNRQMIALRELLRGFSHELGQPVTNIRYSVQLHKMKLEKGFANEKDLLNLLDIILNQTQRIGLLLSRFQPMVSSHSKNSFFSICERIKQVLNNMSARLESANIIVDFQCTEDFSVWGDPIQFDQVFYNLTLNSIQAMPSEFKNGKIEVKVSPWRKEMCSISFSDNGTGIPAEYSRKIFEPFFSTKDPSSSGGNEGLGLFIVWNILKMFGGNITLDPKYSNGARFFISLPIKEEKNNE